MNDPRVLDNNSYYGKRFRRIFRVPFILFRDYIMKQVIEKNFWEVKQTAGFVPIEMRVLMALRQLATGATSLEIGLMFNVGEATARRFFLDFIIYFSSNCFDEWVVPPSGTRLQEVMNVYARLGLPGTIGSMDVTHVRWDRCPAYERHMHVGKEGYPSLAFQVVVDHCRLIHAVSHGFKGACNDQTIARNDEFPMKLFDGKYKDVEYVLFDKDGIPRKCKGGHLITDGGYQQLSIYIQPCHSFNSTSYVLFSECLESVRKDVECTFGILKSRFRMLRKGIEFRSASFIEDIFRCASILHNMLIVFDGYDSLLNDEHVWEALDPHQTEEDENFQLANHHAREEVIVNKTYDLSNQFAVALPGK
jgi:hypothetical protein